MSFSSSDKTDGLDRAEITDNILSALETTITATTTAQVVKVGGSNLANRKYVFIQALGSNVKWGFTSSCPFDAFKDAAIWIPVSDAQDIYVKRSSGSTSVVIAEGA